MAIWSKLFTLGRAGAHEAGAVVDANALRILDQEIRDADKAQGKARDDLAGVRERQAPVIARTRIVYPPRTMERGSPARSPRAPPAGAVQPEFALPRPYFLPQEQQQRRTAAPKGQKKWTRKRIADAVKAMEEGREVEPLKRAPGVDVNEPPVDLTSDGAAAGADDDEVEGMEDEIEEDMDES